MPDAKLQAAMEEIKPILAKYDCAAVVFLQSEGMFAAFNDLGRTLSDNCTKLLKLIGQTVQFSHITRHEPPNQS